MLAGDLERWDKKELPVQEISAMSYMMRACLRRQRQIFRDRGF
jgi:hypothetical protein